MKFCMMSCMLPECSPEEIVSVAVGAGLKAVDWISTHGCKPSYLRKISADAGLVIAAHTMIKEKFLKQEKDYLDDFKESLEDAVIMGAPVLMLPPFPRYGSTSMSEDRKAWMEYFAQAEPLAAQAGVQLTCESTGYRTSPITTAAEIKELLEAVPGLKLTFDNGNVATADDQVASYQTLKDYIVYFHLKDWKIYDTPQPGADLKRCGKYFEDVYIGDGNIDIAAFLNQIEPAHRDLYMNLETRDFTGTLPPQEAFKRLLVKLNTY